MSEAQQYTGKVARVFKKEGTNKRGPWFAYSFKIEGYDTLIRFGFGKQLPFSEGDEIEVSAAITDAAADVADYVEGSGRVVTRAAAAASPAAPAQAPKAAPKAAAAKAATPAPEAPAAPAAKSGYQAEKAHREAYWENKEKRDIEETEPRIRYQNARSAAIEVIGLLLQHDALPASAAKTKAGQAKRFEEVTAAVDKLTVQYFNDTGTLRLLESVADGGLSQPTTAPLPPDTEGEAEDPEQADASTAEERF